MSHHLLRSPQIADSCALYGLLARHTVRILQPTRRYCSPSHRYRVQHHSSDIFRESTTLGCPDSWPASAASTPPTLVHMCLMVSSDGHKPFDRATTRPYCITHHHNKPGSASSAYLYRACPFPGSAVCVVCCCCNHRQSQPYYVT
jgi:hypothetical protein